MENSRGNVAAILMVAAALCVTHAVPGLSQPVEPKRKVYVGTMVAVSLAQDLHHQTSFTVLNNEMTASGDLAIGYGLGFAAVAGRGISDYAALELTGAWSKQSSVLGVSLPASLTQVFSTSGDFELPAGFSYDGNLVALQSKLDLLVYPTKMAMTPGDGAKPYLGGGVGIMRSNIDLDIERDEPTQAFIENLGEFAELLPEKIDDRGTDLQLTLRAGVNVPFNEMDLDLGWQFYRTYIEGENNNSHVASGILKYAF